MMASPLPSVVGLVKHIPRRAIWLPLLTSRRGRTLSWVPGAELHLTELKVKQLQEELAVREATRSGRKRALQLRLRALIIAAAAEEEDEE